MNAVVVWMVSSSVVAVGGGGVDAFGAIVSKCNDGVGSRSERDCKLWPARSRRDLTVCDSSPTPRPSQSPPSLSLPLSLLPFTPANQPCSTVSSLPPSVPLAPSLPPPSLEESKSNPSLPVMARPSQRYVPRLLFKLLSHSFLSTLAIGHRTPTLTKLYNSIPQPARARARVSFPHLIANPLSPPIRTNYKTTERSNRSHPLHRSYSRW